MSDDEHGGHPVCFETTHWSVVLATAGSGPKAAAALEVLCKNYWYPLYAYARRNGQNVEDSKDLTQQLFAQFLEKNSFAQADQGKGRFRSFLLASMQNLMVGKWREQRTIRRGGDYEFVSLED